MDEKELNRVADLGDANLDQTLVELDEAIQQEDPEFAKSLGTISIDNSAVLNALNPPHANADKPTTREARGSRIKELFIQLTTFKKNPKKVLGFWTGLLLLITGAVYVQLTRVWTEKTKLFLNSFSEIQGVEVYDFDREKDGDLFFENPRLARNLVALSRMVANILPTAESSKNPMLAVELIIEGMNTEVVVEIKDREAEFKDHILRLIEQENYEFLNSEKGKLNLALKIREEMNANLTRGQVRKVMYKSFVIKR